MDRYTAYKHGCEEYNRKFHDSVHAHKPKTYAAAKASSLQSSGTDNYL